MNEREVIAMLRAEIRGIKDELLSLAERVRVLLAQTEPARLKLFLEEHSTEAHGESQYAKEETRTEEEDR